MVKKIRPFAWAFHGVFFQNRQLLFLVLYVVALSGHLLLYNFQGVTASVSQSQHSCKFVCSMLEQVSVHILLFAGSCCTHGCLFSGASGKPSSRKPFVRNWDGEGVVPFCVLLFFCFVNCLARLVVKASASGEEDPGFKSHLGWDFFGSSHTSDLKIGTSVATLPGAWHYRVSARTGRPGVSIL